ncbi:probable mediator of RNA polymerase II transcription subunit 26a [Phragmites australis]|uniref:probable mediator of RNA polymerase II transcription subunit 26a n=1 Tax=Phragmites australis TaxID=29695 RepID=UPI002D78F171|nr:probable mediator of RNA polymerase II transcription subunit 26a [Phragmites australis]
MAGQSPLRRWKRFFEAFDAIDAAIEAADPGASRAEHCRARGDLVEMLCDAADDDGERAEGLCLLLDDAMALALETLRVVPVTPAMLTTTNIARAVGDLRKHDSERVRCLARDIFGGWRATIEGHLSTVRAALEKLSQIPPERKAVAPPFTGDVRNDRESTVLKADTKQGTKIPEPPRKTSRVVGSDRARSEKTEAAQRKLQDGYAPSDREYTVLQAHMKQDTKIPDLPKKMPPAVASGGGDRIRSEKTEAAKRKPRDGYNREAEDAKRQRKTPEVVEQRPRKTHPHPIMREMEWSRKSSTTERRFLTSSSVRSRRV